MERREALKRIGLGLGLGGAALFVPGLARISYADGGEMFAAERMVDGYFAEIATELILPDISGTEELKINDLNGLNQIVRSFKSRSEAEVSLSLSTRPDGSPVLLLAQVREPLGAATLEDRLSIPAVETAIAARFNPLPDDNSSLEWLKFNNPHMPGNPLTVEKKYKTPTTLESRGVTVIGSGDQRKLVYIAGRAYPGSRQFEAETAFISN